MLNLYEECKILFAERGIEFKDEFVEIVDTLANRMMNNYKDVLGRVDAESQQHFADNKQIREDIEKNREDSRKEIARLEKKIEDNREEYKVEIKGLKMRILLQPNVTFLSSPVS